MAFKGARGSVTILDRATKPLRSIAEAFQKLGNSSKKTNKDLSATQKAIDSISKSQNRLNRVNQNIKRNTRDIGSQAVGVAALALSFKAALNPAIKFEQSMKDLEAVAFGAADSTVPVAENMKLLSAQARTLGATTAFTATQAAQGQIFLAKAGFKTNQILSTMPSLLDLASASGTELGRTSDILSDLLGAFKLQAKDSAKFADVLAASTSSANVDMETLFETLKVAAPIGNKFGASMEEVVTATSLLGNVGIKGSIAGTALKNAFTNLASPVGEGAKVMKQMGITVEDANGKMLPFSEIMLNLGKQAKTLSQAKQIKVFSAVFGKEAMAGAINLSDVIASGDFEKMLKNLQNSEGVAQKMAKIRMDSTQGSITQLMSAVEGLAIAFGSILTPILKNTASVMIQLTTPLQEFIKNNEAVVKGIGVFAGVMLTAKAGILAYTAAMWLVSPAITALVTSLKVLKVGMIAFNAVAALNPLGAVLVTVTALSAAGIALYQNWEKVTETFEKFWETLKAFDFSDIMGSFKELGAVFGFGDEDLNIVRSTENTITSPIDATRAIQGSNTTNVPVAVSVNIADGKVRGVETSGSTETDIFLNGGKQF